MLRDNWPELFQTVSAMKDKKINTNTNTEDCFRLRRVQRRDNQMEFTNLDWIQHQEKRKQLERTFLDCWEAWMWSVHEVMLLLQE